MPNAIPPRKPAKATLKDSILLYESVWQNLFHLKNWTTGVHFLSPFSENRIDNLFWLYVTCHAYNMQHIILFESFPINWSLNDNLRIENRFSINPNAKTTRNLTIVTNKMFQRLKLHSNESSESKTDDVTIPRKIKIIISAIWAISLIL